MDAAPDDLLEAGDAACPRHPVTGATGVCARCGRFGCDACLTGTVTAGVLCPTCLAAAHLDDLDTFVARRTGRRDGFIWTLGLVLGLYFVFIVARVWDFAVLAIYGTGAFPPVMVAQAGIGVLGLVVSLAYLARWRWSRWAIFLPYLALVGDAAYWAWKTGWNLKVTAAIPFFVLALIPLVLAWRSPVNRLAFGLEVPRPRLEHAYQAYRRNRTATVALALAVPCALVPFCFLFAVPVAMTAWWRSRQPGVASRGRAWAAVILCVVGFGITLAAVAWRLHRAGPGI